LATAKPKSTASSWRRIFASNASEARQHEREHSRVVFLRERLERRGEFRRQRYVSSRQWEQDGSARADQVGKSSTGSGGFNALSQYPDQ